MPVQSNGGCSDQSQESRCGMMRIDAEFIKQCRQADLKAYFEQRGYELRREGSKGHYRVVGHQGLIIKDNMFYQFGTEQKGNSVDCLVNVFGMSFKDALTELAGPAAAQMSKSKESKSSHGFELPPRSRNMRRVFAYLCKTRCIDSTILVPLVKNKLLYQDDRGNCVFVWLDEGAVVGAEIVGTLDRVKFKGVAAGSKYARGFVIKKGVPEKAYFFESAIDLLSFLSLKEGCPKLDNAFFVSLAGLKAAVVEYYLGKYNVTPILCVDNGEAGEAFDKRFLASGADVMKPKNKDWNEDLKEAEGREKQELKSHGKGDS